MRFVRQSLLLWCSFAQLVSGETLNLNVLAKTSYRLGKNVSNFSVGIFNERLLKQTNF
jgi:hypothetical protein